MAPPLFPARRSWLFASAAYVVWPFAARAQGRGGHTVASRVQSLGPAVARRLRPSFERAGVPYPPAKLAFLAFKDARVLELHAKKAAGGAWHFVKSYPILAASGSAGPKLAEGDFQVPEGIYRAESLNPNSRFHVSIRLDYPNSFDRRMARADRRSRPLGGDIMIHGSAVSIGCLAMGDPAAEELFVLAALAGKENVQILVSPTDFRQRPARPPAGAPAWVATLYAELHEALKPFAQQTPVGRR